MMDKLLKVTVITWAAFLILLAGMLLTTQAAEPEPFSAAPVKVDRPEPSVVVDEDPDEDALITAALEEQGYFRADVPLDYELQDVLHSACEEFGVEYSLMLALIEQETLFQNITGDGGDSVGYCQIQKKWWHGLMDDIGAKDLKDPQDNFRTGCAIRAELIDKYGNAEDALSAYNTGNGGKTRYAQEVMARYAAWMERTNV